jgi:hypothetical protein
MAKVKTVRYCDSNSILVVNSRGLMRKLHTPFKVQCISEIGRYAVGTVVYVDEVATGDGDQIIYLIGEGAYYHRHFRIIANF